MITRDAAPFGDFTLTRYSVLRDHAEIRLRAKSLPEQDSTETDIVFSRVAAYFFEREQPVDHRLGLDLRALTQAIYRATCRRIRVRLEEVGLACVLARLCTALERVGRRCGSSISSFLCSCVHYRINWRRIERLGLGT
jgi:hypothetical protein